MTLTHPSQLMDTFGELERHFVEMDTEMVNAVKESERDMYEQRNQQLQTLIISSSVMFAALTALLVEGTIPDGAPDSMIVAYGTVGGLSFALLFICIVVSVEVLRLSSRFMLKRSRQLHEKMVEHRKKNLAVFADMAQKPLENNDPLLHNYKYYQDSATSLSRVKSVGAHTDAHVFDTQSSMSV